MNFQETELLLEEILQSIPESEIKIYTVNKTIQVTPLTQLKKDEKGNYYYDFRPERDCDIVDKFIIESNNKIEVSFYCGGVYYSSKEFQEFIFTASPYHELRIQITFLETPSVKEQIQIKYRSYWINNNEYRRRLVLNSVRTKYMIYRSGMTYKI
jgi:hypothetical protein